MRTLFRKLLKNPTLFLMGIFLLNLSFTADAQQTNLGKVTGSVFDQQDAVIPGNEVTIENKNFRKSVLTNEDGVYSLELPAGIYTVITEQGIWYPVKRASFLVKANETTVINLNPTIRVLSIATEITSKGVREPVEYNSESKFEEFLPFPNAPFNVVIEFYKKKRKGSITEYQGAKLTYNNQSVFANNIRLDKNKLSVEAKGDVTLDINGQRQKKTDLTLQIERVETEK